MTKFLLHLLCLFCFYKNLNIILCNKFCFYDLKKKKLGKFNPYYYYVHLGLTQ